MSATSPTPAIDTTPAFDPALLVTLLDLLPNLYFYVHDYDMRLVYVNKATAGQYNLTKDQLVGRSLVDLGTQSEFERQFHSNCRQIMDGQCSHVSLDPIPAPLPDGSTAYFRRHDIPFRHPDTGQPMIMGIVLDATHEVEHQHQREELAALNREMEIARNIQASLRPAPLALPWLDLAGGSTPATAAAGDFYDWYQGPDGSVTLALGDVTGHGVGPALLAAAARASWRALAGTMPLKDAVLRLNDLLSPDLSNGRFITFAAARLHPTGSLELFSAGHGPLLVRRAGRVESYASHALPLGLVGAIPTDPPTTLHLNPGDALILVSDGFLELRNPAGQEYSESRMTRLLADTPAISAQSLLETIDADNQAFAESGAPADDRTLVIATRCC